MNLHYFQNSIVEEARRTKKMIRLEKPFLLLIFSRLQSESAKRVFQWTLL